jgi:hypothetical protein
MKQYLDLFEQTIIDINNYLNGNEITDSELFLFTFNKIYDSFNTMDLGIILDISESIKEKLKIIFNQKAAIFRFSLAEYIVIPENDYIPEHTMSDFNNSHVINFTYKGVVLRHSCTKISFDNHSIYKIFENIYDIKKNKRK